MLTHTIQTRHQVFVNTDPQRRCYNGAYFSYSYGWSEWSDLETTSNPFRINFWKELNDYAVSQRGESARKEFKLCSK